MKQLPLFPEGSSVEQIINVAAVPQRSPFRYPGGKTWLIPYIRRWVSSLPFRPAEFIEPFAGGASIGLTVAFEQLADHVTLVELDEQVASVWKAIVDEGAGEWLANQITSFHLTPENVSLLLSRSPASSREQALQTIVRNRVNRGGILAPGAGRLKNGESGKGIASRWYPHTLKKRILDINSIRNRLTFICGDGLEILRQNAHRQNVLFFIDPPYTADGKKAGTRLYKYSHVDHDELFTVASTLAGDFVMTYDNNDRIVNLARQYGLETQTIAMKNTHHARLTELLIGRSLTWLRS